MAIEANVPQSDYPTLATPTSASSGNVANAAATATLAGVAGKTTFITGFVVTGAGATAGIAVSVTITGVVGGTMTFTYVFATGVAVGNTPLVVEFAKPIPGTGSNTPIVVSCPASGAGGTNNSVVATGYTL